MQFSRRFVVGGLVGSTVLSMARAPLWAKAPLSGHQVTGAYRHAVGSFEVITLNDGKTYKFTGPMTTTGWNVGDKI